MDSTSILINIRKILRSVNLESKRIQKAYGISIPQILALNYLKECTEFKATHGQLSKYLNLNSSTVTGIISRLEKKGWVAKLPHQSDRRVVFIGITSTGLSQLENAPQLMHEQLSEKLKKLSPKKLEQIEKAFELLIEFMGIEDVEASPLVTVEEIDSK